MLSPYWPSIATNYIDRHPDSSWRDLHQFLHSDSIVLDPSRPGIATGHNHSYSHAPRPYIDKRLHRSWLQPLQRLHLLRHTPGANIRDHGSRPQDNDHRVRNENPSRRDNHRSRRQPHLHPLLHKDSARRHSYKHCLPTRRERYSHQHRDHDMLRNGVRHL